MSPSRTRSKSEVQRQPRRSVRAYNLGQLADLLGAQLAGSSEVEVRGVGGVEDVAEGEITLALTRKHLVQAEASPAAAVIVARGLVSRKPALVSDNPRAAFARALAVFEDREQPAPGVHPSAVVASSAHLDEGVRVGPYCVIGEHCHLGAQVVIGAHSVIGRRCRIGEETVLFPRVTLYEGVTVGARCRLHSGAVIGSDGFGYVPVDNGLARIPQLGSVELGDEVEIGANSCIDRATTGVTRIGSGTKLDNLVQVGHNVSIGRSCIICGQVGIAGSVTIGNCVMLAGQVGIADHCSIGDLVKVGAQSGVMDDLPGGAAYSGFPAQPHRQNLRLLAALRRLPALVDQLRQRGGRRAKSE